MNKEASFKVEDQWEFYLEKNKQTKWGMSEVQYHETKKAFFAGFSQCLIVCREHISLIEDEDEAIGTFQAMLNEIREFFKKEVEFYQSKHN